MSGGRINAATKMVEAAANHAEMLTHLAASNWRTPLTHSPLHNHRPKSSGVVKLGEGIEICEEQLRGVKWSDYRKLTRGLATILFSPMELATCSVTGQRWSRAGTGERPVKPALDRAKVQAIIYFRASIKREYMPLDTNINDNFTYKNNSSSMTKPDCTHLQLQPFPCTYCGKVLSSKSNQRKHIARIHNAQILSPMECTICHKRCKNKYTFWDHLRSRHGITAKASHYYVN